MKQKTNNLTVWENPSDTLNSQYGTVSYKKWCELEATRINAAGGQVMVGYNAAGKVAILHV